MKKPILYSLALLFLLAGILFKAGLFSIGISPYWHYRLNPEESAMIDEAVLKFRERVEIGNFDEIQNQLAENQINEDRRDRIIADIKNSREKYGKPISVEFFRAMLPETTSKYYGSTKGNFYKTLYLTKSEIGEFVEDFDWTVDNREVKLINYSSSKILDWEVKARERDNYIAANYPNEIRIPFGARFVEIRY